MAIDRRLAVLLLAVVMTGGGVPDRPILAADKPAVAKKDAQKAGNRDGDGGSKQDDSPACMHCGATCGLEPICVCESGTKKRPKFEFDTTCEPICVPACGSHVWPFRARAAGTGCTTCCEEPCACPGRVRSCKKLKKETVDEEVPTVVRKVKYVCAGCGGRGTVGCCDVEQPRRRPSAWWTDLTWWWPR